jgi:hypothetical protein
MNLTLLVTSMLNVAPTPQPQRNTNTEQAAAEQVSSLPQPQQPSILMHSISQQEFAPVLCDVIQTVFSSAQAHILQHTAWSCKKRLICPLLHSIPSVITTFMLSNLFA